MKIAIYLRASTDRQWTEGNTAEAQRSVCEAWAARNDGTVVAVYEESGSAVWENRHPQFERLLADAQATPPPFDAIVVYAISRFARSTETVIHWSKVLLENDVRVLSATESFPEARGPAMLLRNTLASYAEFFSIENAERVIACQRQNALNGYFNGAQPPFGYKTLTTDIASRNGYKKKLVVHPQESETIRLVFSLAIDGFEGQAISGAACVD